MSRYSLRQFRAKQKRVAQASAQSNTFEAAYTQLEDRAMLASYVPGELMVQYAPGDDAADQRLTARSVIGAELVRKIHTAAMVTAGSGVMERVRLPEGMSVEAGVAAFQNLPGVVFAEPNWIYNINAESNDTHYTNGNMWGMYSNDQPTAVGPSGTTNQYGSQAEKVWNSDITGSSTIVIGVIDQGIEVLHPDLNPNMWVNPHETAGDGIDNDGNGYIDDIYGWDFLNDDASVYDNPNDDFHGTHVAGTIGARGGNGAGVTGVAWNVTMISSKFLGGGGGTLEGAILAVDYLTDLKTRHGINLIATNNSWGGGGFSQGLLDAIVRGAEADILFVAAAGNSNANNDTNNAYPSNYDTTQRAGYDAVIAVANITSTGAKSNTSSYGRNTVDLGAPGSNIMSTWPGSTYNAISGTSMAAPHVTGAIALYRTVFPDKTPLETRTALLENTTATTSLATITVTGGRLDIWKMLGDTIVVPDISISSVSESEGNSGTKNFVFTVNLSVATTVPVSVRYTTSNQSATAGSDYTSASQILTFAIGETSKTFNISVIGDNVVEPDEVFSVTLSNAVAGKITGGTATGTIVNDDVFQIPNMTIGDISRAEGHSGTRNFNFRVSLSNAYNQVVKFSYVTANGTAIAGSDFASKTGTISFQPGQTSKTVTIAVYGDRTPEANESFFVNLFNPVKAVITDSQGRAIITNDDGGINPQGNRSGSGSGQSSSDQDSVLQSWGARALTGGQALIGTTLRPTTSKFAVQAPAKDIAPSTMLSSIRLAASTLETARDFSTTLVTPSTVVRQTPITDTQKLDEIFAEDSQFIVL